jgi:hypothetical protein
MLNRDFYPAPLRKNIMASKAKGTTKQKGQWRENSSPWYEQSMFYCDNCGMLIPKKQFIVDDAVGQRRYCSTACAALHERLRNA